MITNTDCIHDDLRAEITRLKELNQELYEVVSELSCYKDSPVPNTLIDFAGKLAKKVREEASNGKQHRKGEKGRA